MARGLLVSRDRHQPKEIHGDPMKRPSKSLTPELIQLIKSLIDSNKYHQHQIAAMVGVNQGRISEVKNGHYN